VIAGEKVSHFEILERLGRGGMGVVYKARDLKLHRLVALKFLPSHLGGEDAAERRFLREARTASALDHANICTIYEIGETEDGRTFIAMAYCEGETLAERIARGPLPIEEAVRIGAKVAEGLAEAHARGIVHRDIKPGNIAITNDGGIKILDFGLATVPGAARITQGESTSGTAAYMSPEQIRGEPVDPRTDIWSWGVVMYEMLTGHPPFAGDNVPAVIFSILKSQPKKISSIAPVPRTMESIVEKALSKNPPSRYRDAGELLEDLPAPDQSESMTAIMPVTAPIPRGLGRPALLRRWPLAVLAAAILLGSVWAVRHFRSARPRPKDAASSTTVAVLPFRYRGSDQYRYLGDGMVDLLSAKLDRAGELRAIDPRAIAGLSAGEGALDPERGRLAAERLHSHHFVLGSVVEIGGKVQIDATLYSTDGRRDPLVQTAASGEVAKAFDLVDELAIGLLGELGAESSVRSTRVAAVTTSSLPAFRSYLDGESAFQRGDFRSSVEAFRKAVELDPEFALAWYRLSVALEWLGTPQELHTQAAEQADRHADRLSDRDRRLLEASRVWRQGNNREAKRLYGAIVQAYPDEIEGWYQLGEVLFHRNALYGGSIADSREPFERVLSYQPNHFASLVHLARVEALEGHLDAMKSLVARFLALGKESRDRVLAIRALQAFAVNDRLQEDEVLDELSRSEDPALAISFLEVSLYGRNFPGAERIARLLTAPSRPPRVRAYGHVALAHLALARGRWSLAKNELQSIAASDPWTSLEYRALLSCLPFVSASRSELSSIRDGLAALDPANVPRIDDPEVFVDAHYDLHPLLRMYLMALVSVRMGDVDGAEKYAGQIEQQKFPAGFQTLASDLTRSVRAQIDRAQGKPIDALKELEPILAETKNPLESPIVSEASERFTRTELLVELGRDPEALPWLDHLVESSVFEFVYLPVSYLRRAEIHDRMHDPKSAAADYRSFIDLWGNCDPDLRPTVDLARRKLAGLEAAAASASGRVQ
jgi:tetratricopeptide (TPR) repeat protein/tRNA A-37 threonylcarbamoyl transferase component Bud32